MRLAAAFTDNASVNTYLLPGGKQLVAMTETLSGTLRVDAGSLHTEGHITYNDDLKGDITTAHPVIYPDGSIYNLFIVVSLPPCNKLCFISWLHLFLRTSGLQRSVVLPHSKRKIREAAMSAISICLEIVFTSRV